jgi:hypothetical protein
MLADVFLLVLLACIAVSLGLEIKEHDLRDGWYDGVNIFFAVNKDDEAEYEEDKEAEYEEDIMATMSPVPLRRLLTNTGLDSLSALALVEEEGVSGRKACGSGGQKDGGGGNYAEFLKDVEGGGKMVMSSKSLLLSVGETQSLA